MSGGHAHGLIDVNSKTPNSARAVGCPATWAFTLLELVVVFAVIALLAALLLPAFSRAKALAQRTTCQNHLRQIGLGLVMYVSDFRAYPPLWDDSASQVCFEKLLPYYPLVWTNTSWHCPTYLARNGLIFYHVHDRPGSYCYNWRGIANGWGPGCPEYVYQLQLGLGHRSRDMAHSVQEPEVRVPSEMYTVADVRAAVDGYMDTDVKPAVEKKGVLGNPKMMPWTFVPGTEELPPPHQMGYDVLFADGHVALVSRSDYLFPPRTAHNWNRDNQPHPEAWAPRNRWAVQN